MKNLSIAFLLFMFSTVAAQTDSKTIETKIFIRYDKPVGEYRIGEDLVGLTEIKNKENIAVRICSNQTFPEAILKAKADPFLIVEKLTNDFAFLPEKTYFLLSKDCITDGQKEAVEIWLISNKLDYPTNEKVINSTQVILSPVGKNISNRGMTDYKNASKELLKKLQSNAAFCGVIKGYYLNKPSNLLKKRVKEIEALFKKNNISNDRYKLLFEPWSDEISISPKDREPVYPNIYLLTISTNIKNQDCFSYMKSEE